jgi:hypothetical protein
LITNKTSKTTCTLNSHCLSFQCDYEPEVVFYLPSITLNANHQINVHNTLIDFDLKIAPLYRELNAEVIAQLFFVTKVFLKEINYILLAVYNLDQNNSDLRHKNAKTSAAANTTKAKQQQQQHSIQNNSILFNIRVELGQISLTGITPTASTALTICSGEKSTLTVTNNNITDSKTQIESQCLINLELKTIKQENNEPESGGSPSSSPIWYQLAFFTTKFDLRNYGSSNEQRESIIINVEKPRFFLQPGAIDSAILFWLNYKNTYEFWIDKRQQFSNLLLENFPPNLSNSSDNKSKKLTKLTEKKNASSSQFLLIKLRVSGLGLALPLSNKISRDFSSQSVDCLVITLNETAIYACSSGCVVSKGQFSNFCLRFSENFNLASSEWAPQLPAPGLNPQEYNKYGYANSQHQQRGLMNAWVVPSGNYEVCSSTIEKPTALSKL